MRLRLVQPYIYKTSGPVTGKEYRFEGFASELEVDDEDAKVMIEKRTVGNCNCTGTPPQIIFEIVESSTEE